MRITRRQALRRIGAGAAAAAFGPRLLAGCGDEMEAGITNVVSICMENRSYDHYLGGRALEGLGGEGLTAGMSNLRLDGTPVAVYPAQATCVADPPHSWTASHEQWNGGLNDAFLKAYEEDEGVGIEPHVMGYLNREELPITWAMADGGTSCDAWFCSILGPTWPNRMYLHSGQSGGLTANALPEAGLTWPTIHHRLQAKGIDWAYYFTDLPFLTLWQDLPIERIRRVNYQFFDDAEKGILPQVTFIDPGFSFGNDDHPPHHPVLGQQFLASIYTALANSPQWRNLLMVVTYDEHGGFFDHVPPPTTVDDRAADGFDRMGFRVPTLILGPYVKQGYISHTVHDHTSTLAHIERMFGLEPLNARVTAANDLSDAIDMERLAQGRPARPLVLPPVVVDQAELDACFGRAAKYRVPTDLEKLADQRFFRPEHDLRRLGEDHVRAIASVLERYGGGGIRRRSR